MASLSSLMDYWKTGMNVISNAVGKNKMDAARQKAKNNLKAKGYTESKNILGATKFTAPNKTTSNGGIGSFGGGTNNSGGGFRDTVEPTPVDSKYGSGLLTGGESSYSGGVAAPAVASPAVEDYAIDLSDILAAYTKSAEAQKQTIKDTTESQRQILANNLASQLESLRNSEKTQRETLTKALDRFREDTNKSRQQQQSAFNSSRADLEAQAYLANRQALQSAAARGLGGSGLQQLAQLQNLINQSAETSNLAKSNTDAISELAQALARQEEDTTTNLTNLANTTDQQARTLQTQNTDALNALLSNSANKLNEIDTNTASLQKQLQYQEAVRAQDARRQAEQFAANLAAQNASTASNWALYNQQKQDKYNDLADQTTASLAALITDAANKMKSASKSSTNKKASKALTENNAAVQAAYDTAVSDLANIYGASGLDKSIYLDPYSKQLADLYSKYYVTK